MSYFLSALIPSSAKVSYPCVDVTAATRIASLDDYSGNGHTLFANGTGSDRPLGELSSLNGHPSVVHAGESPLAVGGSTLNLKELWIMCRYDLAANFGAAYRGLVSGATAGDALVGNVSDTKFVDFGLTGAFYYKSQVNYPSTYPTHAFTAPFTKFEVIRTGATVVFGMDDVQVGQDRDYDGVAHGAAAARRWYGRWMDLHAFQANLTANEVRSMNLYYDLKYEQWLNVGTTLEFPDPTITGIGWNHFKAYAQEWDTVTDTVEYEDGGMDFNERTDTPMRTWDIGFTGLTAAQMEIFDTFNNVARRSRTFSMVDKFGVTQTGLRIKSYSSSHNEHKAWNNTVQFNLVKYP